MKCPHCNQEHEQGTLLPTVATPEEGWIIGI